MKKTSWVHRALIFTQVAVIIILIYIVNTRPDMNFYFAPALFAAMFIFLIVALTINR